MKIIISPAKKMQEETEIMDAVSLPAFLDDTKKLHQILAGYSKEELKALFRANDQITELNFKRYQEMKPETAVTPAVLSYVGIQYQSMAPRVFTNRQWAYVKEHLFILSGFYGALRAMDAVVPYRLEMQAKLPANGCSGLYEFWGDRLYKEIMKEDRVLVNLASKEYSSAVLPYLKEEDECITCIFGELSGGKVKVKATEAKMARGTMVRWMAEKEILKAEDLKEFKEGGYSYSPERSTRTRNIREFVFLKGG